MSKTIVSIDIGKKGAICIRPPEKPGDSEFILYRIPLIKNEVDYGAMYRLIYDHTRMSPSVVVFERLGVIFGTGKLTAFSMGYQSGAVEMICISAGIPYHKIPPRQWQKEMFSGTPLITRKSKSGKSYVTDTKATALMVVKQLFPNQILTFGDRSSKPHDGIVDAILLNEYARRRNL